MPIALMFVVLYFLLIRPQQKRAREHETMVQNLKRNDEIVTSGGIYGRVQSIADKVLVLEIAPNVRIRLDRAQVASVVRGAKPEEREKDKEKEKA
jgi:preprotein translocase subunit YajC